MVRRNRALCHGKPSGMNLSFRIGPHGRDNQLTNRLDATGLRNSADRQYGGNTDHGVLRLQAVHHALIDGPDLLGGITRDEDAVIFQKKKRRSVPLFGGKVANALSDIHAQGITGIDIRYP